MPFSSTLIVTLLSIVFIEIALSVDNAILLSSFASLLPNIKLQRLSLFAGLILAFALRLLLIYYLEFIFANPWVQILGGLYLLFLSWRYIHALFFKKKDKTKRARKPKNFFITVLKIEFCDLIFAMDSILAAFALIYSVSLPDLVFNKVYFIFLGTCLGMIIIRIASMFLLSFIQRQSFLKNSAHFMIGWIGIKMVVQAILPSEIKSHTIIESIFWSGLLCAFVLGALLRKKSKNL